MMWTRHLMRTAFVFLVTMSMLANESNANIRTEWIHIDDGMTMERVIVLETDGHRLFAGTKYGLYISMDHGFTWHSSGLEHPVKALAIHQNTVYAGTNIYHGVFRSDDHGVTWKPINDGFRVFDWGNGEKFGYGTVLQIFVTSSGTVITVMRCCTYTSADRGETWHDVSKEWKVLQLEAPDWIITNGASLKFGG